MRVPDTHAHLDSEQFDGDRDEIVVRAVRAGVTRILAVGSDLRTSEQAVSFAHRYPEVFAAVGMHPHEAGRFHEDAIGLQTLLDEEKVVAVGEIGLDFYHDWVPHATQAAAFRAQLAWAVERGFPVSIHSRGAETEVLRHISNMRPVAIMHCFGGDLATAMRAVALGCSISFAGNVTYRNASGLRDVARSVPLERLLAETDSPALAPRAYRGRRNEPAHVVEIVEFLARERGEPADYLASAIAVNATALFGWGAE